MDSLIVLRTIESNRFVTGVTWVDGELWHRSWEGDESDIRRIDPKSLIVGTVFSPMWSPSACDTAPCAGWLLLAA